MGHLKKNIASGGILAIGNIIISLISYPLYLKFLGTELYGIWALLAIFITFGDLGMISLDGAVAKYVAEINNDKKAVKQYTSTALIIFLILSGFLFFLIFALKSPIINLLKINVSFTPLMLAMAALSLFMAMIKITSSALKGLGRIDMANYVFLTAKFIGIICSLIMLKFNFGIWSLFLGYLIFYTLLMLAIFYIIYKYFGFFLLTPAYNKNYAKKLLKFGGAMSGGRLASLFVFPFNKIIISRYIGLNEVTYFEIASQSVMQIRNIFDQAIWTIMPEVSRAKENAKILLDKSLKIIIYAGWPIFGLLFLFGPILLQIWLNNEYNKSIGDTFKIMLAVYAIDLTTIPLYYIFMGAGKVMYCLYAHIVQLMVNITLVLIATNARMIDFKEIIFIYSIAVVSLPLTLVILYFKFKKQMRSN